MDQYVTGAVIKALREKAKLTQAQLAEKLNVSDKAVSKWESEAGFPEISQLPILAKLFVEFITPIDQEDILSLVQIIDDVTDALDEVVLACYMFHISELSPHMPELAAIVCRCVCALRDAVAELKNFKKPQHLRELLVQINSIESEADAVYAKAIHTLFATTDDTKRILGCKAVCEDLEHCCDLCEHAADVIDRIILINT